MRSVDLIGNETPSPPPPSSSTAGNLRLPLLFCIFYVHLGLFPVADNNDLFTLIIIFLFVCLCFSVWIHSWFHSNEFVIEDNKNRIRSPFFFSFQILFWPNFGFRFSFFFLLLLFFCQRKFIHFFFLIFKRNLNSFFQFEKKKKKWCWFDFCCFLSKKRAMVSPAETIVRLFYDLRFFLILLLQSGPFLSRFRSCLVLGSPTRR